MCESSDDGERFSRAASSSSPLLLSRRLVLSYVETNPPRLVPRALEADVVGTGLVAAVPHFVEVTRNIFAAASLPSQLVATAEKQPWKRKQPASFSASHLIHNLSNLTDLIHNLSDLCDLFTGLFPTNLSAISMKANFLSVKIEDLLANIHRCITQFKIKVQG